MGLWFPIFSFILVAFLQASGGYKDIQGAEDKNATYNGGRGRDQQTPSSRPHLDTQQAHLPSSRYPGVG